MDLNLPVALASVASLLIIAAMFAFWPIIKKIDYLYVLIVKPRIIIATFFCVAYHSLKRGIINLIERLIVVIEKIKPYLVGEYIMINGTVSGIEEEEEIIFSISNNPIIHLLNISDVTKMKYCFVKIRENSLRKSVLSLKFNESQKSLEENYNLCNLSRVNIVCRKWWWNKEFLYPQKILYSN